MFSVRANENDSHFDIRSNLKGSVLEAIKKNTQKPDCGWEQTGGPQVGSLTFDFINPGHAISDFLVILPFPVKRLWLSAIATISKNNSYMFHFRPLNRSYNSNAVDVTGAEPWLPMRANTDPSWTNVLNFKKPISQFYLDIGFEDGGGSHLTTFMFSDDSFDVTYFPAETSGQ
jgi:hypothetical protein